MAAPPSSFLCPITGDIMADPVSTSDGFSYEREAISEWFATGQKSSPMTGAPLDRSTLVPNHALRSAIQEYVNAHPQVGEDVYRPRDLGVIRQTIGSRQWAPPQVGLYPEASVGATPMGLPVSPPAMPVAVASPVGAPVPIAEPVAIVRPPPPPPLEGLTLEDRNLSSGCGVPDWKAFLAPPKKATGFFGFGASSRAPATPRGNNEPKLRLIPPAGGGLTDSRGGVTLEVTVESEAAFLQLARRLAAPETQPVASLRIKATSGDGFGTMADGFSASGAAFRLLSRALHTASGQGATSLSSLLELKISHLEIGGSPAAMLAAALAGHPTLKTLEVWKCGVDDEGAMCLGALAAVDGNAALVELNLGSNLFSGACRERLEALVERQRVHVSTY